MTTQTTNNKFIVMVTAMLMCLLISIAPLTQAAATPGTPFNHAQTGFLLKDVHTSLKCEQCHVDGIFKNTPKECSGCHSKGTRVGATPKPTNHVQTTASCDTCHTNASTFLVKSFKHVGVSGACSTCHNGQSLGVLSKPATHFPTMQPCEKCHTNTATFLGWKMDHTGITSGCAACHSGQFPGVMNKPAFHITIPTGTDCGTCHASTITFLGAKFDHATNPGGVTNKCNTCHNGTYPGVLGKTVSHIPTNNAQCDTCHDQTNTSNYTSFLGAQFNHTTATQLTPCSACHNGVTAKGKTLSTHLSTSIDCVTCHNSNNNVSYTTWLNAKYHANVAVPAGTRCDTCHNANIATGKSATHLVTALDCVSCHDATSTSNYVTWLGARYTHATPVPACSNCHNGTNATGKSTSHVSTALECSICHSAANAGVTWIGAVYAHAAPVPACASCHDGLHVNVTGKSATHIATGVLDCSSCHTAATTNNFVTWLGAAYSHSPAPTQCSICHDGTHPGVTGKSGTHLVVPPGTDCISCHTATNTNTYKTWLGATFTHNPDPSTTGGCLSCHDGVTKSPKLPLNHLDLPTYGPDCYGCHNSLTTAGFTTWLGAKFTHSSSLTTCSTNCHDGTHATGKPATAGQWAHPSTALECGSSTCHDSTNNKGFTTFFITGGYAHKSSDTNCSTCHDGIQAMGMPTTTHIPIAGIQCSVCHSNAQVARKWAGGIYNHITPPVSTWTCATCHNGTKASMQPTNHLPVIGDCAVCHNSGNNAGFTTWLNAKYHANQAVPAATRCDTCHNGATATGIIANPNHVTVTSAFDCVTCHNSTANAGYTTWLGAKYHANLTAGSQPTSCATCHNGVIASKQSASHLPVAGLGDCSGCHTSTNTSTFKNWLGVKLHATTVNITAVGCSSCHDGKSATGLSSYANHIPVAGYGECGVCHTSTANVNFTTWLNAKLHKSITGINAGCSVCHDGKKATGKSATHLTTTADCVTCHTSAVNASDTTWLGAKFTHSATTTPCSNCHNGLTATGKPTSHVLTAADCISCHTVANTLNFTQFLGASGFNHQSPTPVVPGTCAKAGCHDGSSAKGLPIGTHIPTATISCDGCHATYNGTSVLSFVGATMNHTLAGIAAPAKTCLSCHNGSYTTQGTLGAQAKVSNHIPTTITGTLDCTTCHTITITAASASMSWAAPEKMNHNAAQGGGPVFCVTCHLSGTAYLGSMQKKSHNGASATVTKDCSASGCHKPKGSKGTAYSKWN